MNLPTPRISRNAIAILLAAFVVLMTGCYYPTDGRSVYATGSRPANDAGRIVPTALVIVVEDESTEAEYQVRRSEIIDYLIQRGYISNEAELVSDPANADRIVRAIVSNGGYSLSIFNQNSTGGADLNLEDTDLLYPADPYFILGFYYLDEIGPRRLPPRPPGYRPHPRPPHSSPPPGYRVFDHDRHWSRPGQPDRNDGQPTRPPDRRRPDDKQPRPDQSAHQPPPAPDRKPEDRGPPHPDNRGKPPAAVPPASRDHAPRPDQDGNKPPANNQQPDRDHARSGQDGHAQPAAGTTKGTDRTPSRDTGHPPPRSDTQPARAVPPPPPQAAPAPAPARSESPPPKTQSDDDREARKQ